VCVVLFFCVGSYCMDPYNRKRGVFFNATFGTKIKADFGDLVVVGSYCAGRTTLC
jgi:hypothetical protein